MTESERRAQHAEDGATQLKKTVARAKEMKDQGYSNVDIANVLGISENYVRSMVEPEINWGYNCLTTGVHHGRPEALWNLPLLYAATVLFSRESLALLVLTRIHQDALQVTLHNQEYTTAWANRVRAAAEEKYDRTLQHKVGELKLYYKGVQFAKDLDTAVRLNAEEKLNRGYEPLHSHDTINMLCRIIAVSSIRAASQ